VARVSDSQSGSSVHNYFLFQGHELLSSLGVYDFRNREYDPARGRFLQIDPIRFGGGYNLYRFAGNNPVSGSDPSGLTVIADFGGLESSWSNPDGTFQSDVNGNITANWNGEDNANSVTGRSGFFSWFWDFLSGSQGSNSGGITTPPWLFGSSPTNSSWDQSSRIPLDANNPRYKTIMQSFSNLHDAFNATIAIDNAISNFSVFGLTGGIGTIVDVGSLGIRGGIAFGESLANGAAAEETQTLFHYTDEKGPTWILDSGELNPSLKALNPNDVRYGNGQYLSDIVPGTKTPAQLSREFLGQPFQGQKYTHYIEIDVSGLNVVPGRPGVFVVPGETPLDLTGRIISSGAH
jgi:RHS repeat-associated protein